MIRRGAAKETHIVCRPAIEKRHEGAAIDMFDEGRALRRNVCPKCVGICTCLQCRQRLL